MVISDGTILWILCKVITSYMLAARWHQVPIMQSLLFYTQNRTCCYNHMNFFNKAEEKLKNVTLIMTVARRNEPNTGCLTSRLIINHSFHIGQRIIGKIIGFGFFSIDSAYPAMLVR